MYADFTVPIPQERGRITRKTIKGTTYIYYQMSREYDPETQYTIPKATPIGKCSKEDMNLMIPNEKYLLFFPDAELPTEKNNAQRSGCLRIGTYIVLKKIIEDYHLDLMLEDIFGDDKGLFLDIAIYTIITENNAGQYYPEYAYNHPLFTKQMKIYSDTRVSEFTNEITRDQIRNFLEMWNEDHIKKDRIYVSYDSTNKTCQAGDIEFVEHGHPKVDVGKPMINYSIAYDHNNEDPLFYEMYSGSIVDISELRWMLQKASGFGYKNVGFILDRGYFGEENIRFMDKNGFAFVIMMKGMKNLVRELVLKNKGLFEESWEHNIPDHKVNGTTVKRPLFAKDEKDRYIHIYFSEEKRTTERRNFEEKIKQLEELFRQKENSIYEFPKACEKYFDPIYHVKGQEKTFLYARPRKDAIEEEIKVCGYFTIVTSSRMTAEEAIDLYRSRDASEKLFRGDKSYLGNKCYRVHSSESAQGKTFIEFVALIIRNRLYRYLKEQMKRSKKREYMTVPAAIRELEKIELIRQPNGDYVQDHAVTATQKEILKSFGMDAGTIRKKAYELNLELKGLKVEDKKNGQRKERIHRGKNRKTEAGRKRAERQV